jgi:hypothetical protein
MSANLPIANEWDHDAFLGIFREALLAIREPRFYSTERGYQGKLLAELEKRLPGLNLPGNPVVEQEYQKRVPDHGLNIRPDILIHIPFERAATEFSNEGNFVAIEIKRRATYLEARGDFDSLHRLSQALKYPLTIFLNIDSDQTHFQAQWREKCPSLVFFAVKLAANAERDGQVEIRAR